MPNTIRENSFEKMNKSIFTKLFHSTSLLERKPRAFGESVSSLNNSLFAKLLLSLVQGLLKTIGRVLEELQWYLPLVARNHEQERNLIASNNCSKSTEPS
ncbi:hypothetical protein JHK82_024722 [Glycine max]|nr:hypothetical protein JHK85_025324 [Glycine max]KAG5012577.1 hypothetical protein JHK86_024838 [Glycine max]KAG5133534.1 hypothetical protein JHK82_024722 [Glycine max]